MSCAIMGNLDGTLTRLAFDPKNVKQILSLDMANLVVRHEKEDLFLSLEDHVCHVERVLNGGEVGKYFIVLNSWKAFNVKDYQVLFNVRELPDHLVSGIDVAGREHLCARYVSETAAPTEQEGPCLDKVDERLKSGEISREEVETLRRMISGLKQGQFYEALTKELSNGIKEIAQELMEFRRDLQHKIEPDIVEIAEKDIPEASNQLEGINETLEKSTMDIMDINEAQLELASHQAAFLKSFVEGEEIDQPPSLSAEEGVKILRQVKGLLARLPGEAKDVAGFLVPQMDQGISLLAENGDKKATCQFLADTATTIQDLVRDLGGEGKALIKLKRLGEELNGLLNQDRKCVPEREKGAGSGPAPDQLMEVLRGQMEAFERIKSLAMSMSKPLSFQDLVGQRIQRIIRLVKSMELRIQDLVISFGIKIRKHKEDPSRSFEDLKSEVEEYKSELKGPQNDGEGMDQNAIDDLLASL